MDLIGCLCVYLSLVQAEYWHDPFNLEEYRKSCVFLPDINQENVCDNSILLPQEGNEEGGGAPEGR